MKPLKAYVWRAWCVWNGHQPVPGTYFSVVYGKRMPCICCSKCRVIL
jgi:hypothetical protein